MRKTFVWHKGRVVEKGTAQAISGPQLIVDLAPYQSVVTGEKIDGRRAHREHLRRHDLVEVGNIFKGVANPIVK